MGLNINIIYSVLLFLLSPVLALYSGLKNLNDRGKLFILTLFGFFYGVLIQYSEGNDAAAYVRKLTYYESLTFEKFIQGFWDIITFTASDYAPTDLYLHLLLGISGSFFHSKLVLFSLVGLVYGYFYGAALLKIIKIRPGQSIGILMLALILLFVIHRSYDSMQTIRSWTGMWVLFNGVAGYHLTKGKRYLFMVLFSPFFHLMYVFISIPALILIFLKRVSPKIIIGIYLISFIANINTLTLVETSFHNEFTQKKLSSYYRIDQSGEEIDPIAQRQESSNAVWYVKYGKTTAVYAGATFFIFFLIVFGYFSKKRLSEMEYGLLGTGILMAALANFLSFAFALYSRTMANATTYILAVMVLLALNGTFGRFNAGLGKRILLGIGVLIFVPKMVFFLSDFMYRTSFLLFSSPWLGFFGDDFNFSIRDIIDLLI